MALSLIAPAKINLTLEVLGRRPDGYHELRSVLQTVSLADHLSIEASAAFSLEVTGRFTAALTDDPSENLVLRAARELAREASVDAGARIRLDKAIPPAMGFGGGSSDAAATLRGLDQLWDAHASLADLAEIGGRLGADVPFFLQGGTRSVSGRGSLVHRLPDLPPTPLLLLTTSDQIAAKTGQMYARLTPADFTTGAATAAAIRTIETGGALDPAQLVNVFDRIAAAVAPTTARAIELCRDAGLAVHVSGSGPGLFVYGVDGLEPALTAALAALGVETFAVETLGRDAAVRVEAE